MRAVRIDEFGDVGTLKVDTLPKPEPSPDEVLVRVRAAGVNPYDWMTREGDGARVSLPWIPGWDLSGTVEEVGEDVAAFGPGEEVHAMLADRRGAYAEYVCVPSENLVPKPSSLTHTHAAGAPMASLTAWQALFTHGRLRPNERVLIHAAAGGVGHVAVQLANWIGARTVGTASESNRGYLERMGLDQHVDYRAERFEEVVEPVDLVIDPVGGETLVRSLEILKPDGHVAKLPGPLREHENEAIERHGSSGSYPIVQWRPEQLRAITYLLDGFALGIRVGHTFPLESVKEAHKLSQSGHARGKIVLEM